MPTSPTPHRPRPVARRQGQRGDATVELVLATPLLLLLVFGTIQFALWQHAQHIAAAAAQEAARTARIDQGTAEAGQTRGETFLAELAPGSLTGTTVTVTRSLDEVQVNIHGHTTAGLFDLTLPVHAQVTAPVERFRPDPGTP